MRDTYKRHKFQNFENSYKKNGSIPVDDTRSKVKVICVLVAKLKKTFKKPCSIIVDDT
jgi:hypothetical protein